jgi:eukaryotic-like serine/threonine-protein kinase
MMVENVGAPFQPFVPTLGGNSARTGVHPGPGPNGRPHLQWRIQTGAEIMASPILGNGLVYIGSSDRNLFALEFKTGRERWRYEAGSGLITTATLDGGFIYSTFMETIFALDAATGDEGWFASAYGHNASTPAISGDNLSVTGDTRLYTFAASTGDLRWIADLGGVVLNGAPAISGGMVHITCTLPNTERVRYLAVDAMTGTHVWSVDFDGWWDVIPVVTGGYVYVANSDGVLRALDAATGHERWTAPIGSASVSIPAVAENRVYVSADRTLFAFDAATGAARWHLHNAGGALTIADAVIYSVLWDGPLVAVDATTGTEQWRLDTGGGAGAATVADGLVIVGGRDGSIRAFA